MTAAKADSSDWHGKLKAYGVRDLMSESSLDNCVPVWFGKSGWWAVIDAPLTDEQKANVESIGGTFPR